MFCIDNRTAITEYIDGQGLIVESIIIENRYVKVIFNDGSDLIVEQGLPDVPLKVRIMAD